MASKVKISREFKVLGISIAVAVGLVMIGIVSGNRGVLGNSVILSIFIIATPQFLIRYEIFRDVKEMEERFPLFLRDIIELLRSGMPLHQAIRNTTRFDYGRLSKEISKMSNELSWGTPINKVLDNFSKRIKKSKRMFTSIKIIRESHLSGGDVISTIESVADNSTILEESEKEKKSMLNQYVIMMYAISIVFIIIVVAINNLMIPIFTISTMEDTGLGDIGLSDPCDNVNEFEKNVCDVFNWTASTLFSAEMGSIAAYYTSLFFFMSLIQSIFSGLVAGQISENSVIAGLKHSMILSGIVFGAFSILTYLGFLGGG